MSGGEGHRDGQDSIRIDDLEEYYYDTLFPLAIEYGMAPHQFWDEDMRLFDVYQKAYIMRLHNQGHISGLYVYEAFGIAYSNAWGNGKKLEYPNNPHSPFAETKKGMKLSEMRERENTWATIKAKAFKG